LYPYPSDFAAGPLVALTKTNFLDPTAMSFQSLLQIDEARAVDRKRTWGA